MPFWTLQGTPATRCIQPLSGTTQGLPTDLIYSVRIIREEAKPEPVYIHSESSGGYKTAEEVVSRVDLFDEARKKAYARIGEAEASLRQLEEIAGRHRPDSSRAINKIANAMNQAQRALHAV
jgi:hypothetical protein